MTAALLIVLLLPVLCTAHSIQHRSLPPSCPEHICECRMAEGPTTKRQQQEANCKEMPSERLTKTITALRVNGQITTITKKMITTLGGDLLSLDLSDCEIQNIEPGSFDGAPKLVTLKLSGNQIEEIGPGMFKMNKALKELYLDGNKLKHVDESAFSKLDHLRVLHLERNYLTQFPPKIPIGLTVLNVSQNNLGPDLGCEIHETNLKELNLCGNHLEKLTNTTLYALNKLQNLCIGNKAAHFPKNTSMFLPHLSDLSLVASTDSHAELDPVTQAELAAMNTLTSLTIVNYKLKSLSFLHGLTKLRHLTLQDVMAPGAVDFQSIMLSKTSLTVLNLADSKDLAHALLDRMQVLGALSTLQTISLHNTSITHLASFDVPKTNGVRLDISENPLHCDCGFAWLKRKKHNTGIQYFLLNADDTICAAPGSCVGKKLLDVVNNMDCLPEDHREIRDSTSGYYRPHGKPISFPSNPQSSGGDMYHQHRPINHDVRFPNRQDQDRESQLLTHSEQGGEPDFPTHPEQGGEPDYATHSDKGGEPGFPVYPDHGVVHEFPDQVGEPGFSTDSDTIPDQAGYSTVEPMVTDEDGGSDVEENQSETATYKSEDEGVAKEHIPSPTSDSSLGLPEHMPRHDQDTSGNDYGIVYIILGTILGLLVLVGVILAIFYWHFKKTGGNKITPSSGMPSTSDVTPVEPTFQQLQHTEGSSLLKNVKK